MGDFRQVLEAVRETLEENGISAGDRKKWLDFLDAVLTMQTTYQTQNIADTLDALREVIMERGDLLAIIQQQAAELDTLKRLSLNLTASLDLQTVLRAVVHEAMSLMKNARTAHIFLYDDESNQLRFGAALSSNGHLNEPWAKPRPTGLTFTVARQGETIVVEDMQKHPLYEDVPPDWKGSIVGIPLKMGDRVVGVMNLSRSEVGPFSPSELRLLQLLANQAAIAIVNARLHEQVSRQALSDTLTGLPNRRALDEHLEKEVQRARRHGYPFAVLMMDLDGFKAINDNYGHDVGDQVLRVAFNYLARGLRTTDFLARYGGDELTLVLSRTDLSPAITVAEKLLQKMRRFSYELPDGKRLRLGLSGGIAVYPIHGQTSSQLLRAADEALYRAKKYQRGSFKVARGPTGPFAEL